MYIGLNRSCSQRKFLELFCVLNRRTDERVFLRDAKIMSGASVTFRVLYHDNTHAMVYLVLERNKLTDVLSIVSELPRLVFASCKNQIYRGNNVADNMDKIYDKATIDCKLAYVVNFVLYHVFHENDRSFDEKRFGVRSDVSVT